MFSSCAAAPATAPADATWTAALLSLGRNGRPEPAAGNRSNAIDSTDSTVLSYWSTAAATAPGTPTNATAWPRSLAASSEKTGLTRQDLREFQTIWEFSLPVLKRCKPGSKPGLARGL